ncbi:hypothetical protein [Candidatus Methanodesulfokora washburnensis]|nr:hypothetical protein [Candidatus Methanodesulfokores washburnensis]
MSLMVYSKKVGVAICTRKEVEESFGEGKEAGMFLKQLLEYLDKLGRGEE